MKSRFTLPLIALASLCITHFSAIADEVAKPKTATTFTLNLTPENCQVYFKIGATAHTVRGDGPLLPSALHIDTAKKSISGRVAFDVLKITTHSRSRDKNMHNNILETKKYPDLYYEPIAFSGDLIADQANSIIVQGKMMIHGVEHALDIPMTVTPHEKNLAAQADFIVPYVEWGMKDPSVLFLRVEKKAHVHLELKADLI